MRMPAWRGASEDSLRSLWSLLGALELEGLPREASAGNHPVDLVVGALWPDLRTIRRMAHCRMDRRNTPWNIWAGDRRNRIFPSRRRTVVGRVLPPSLGTPWFTARTSKRRTSCHTAEARTVFLDPVMSIGFSVWTYGDGCPQPAVHDVDAPNRCFNVERRRMTDVTQRPDAEPHAVQHLTFEERAKLGKEARARTSRSSHAEFSPATNRPDPVSLLERQAITRVNELLPIRYGRMLVSPFTFFRGAALSWPPT